MKPKMRLYVWQEVLVDHYAGIAFALAESVDEARQIIIKKMISETGGKPGDEPDFEEGMVKILKNDLSAEPEVYETAVGFFTYGYS